MRPQTLTAAGERAYARFGRSLGRKIGAHTRLIGRPNTTQTEYLAAQRESDEAIAVLRCLVCTVKNRHIAYVVAHAAGCPGYLNLRGR